MTTKKKTETKNETKQNSKKEVLYELVQKSDTSNYIIVGALSRAGLLAQYEYEKEVYGKEVISPTITEAELDKIIKTFLGE